MSRELSDHLGRKAHTVGDERALMAELARFGAVHTRRLRELGLAEGAVRHRVRTGRLRRLHRDVYVLGGVDLPWPARCRGAALALGERVALGRRSAAGLRGLLRVERHAVIEVVTRRAIRSPPGIAVHRTRHLTRGEVDRLDGIPVTTVARTLADLAPWPRLLRAAAREADHQRVLDLGALAAQLDRHPRGARELRRLLGEWRDEDPTLNAFETRLRACCERAGIRDLECQVPLGAYTPDFVIRSIGLVIETDGWQAHGTRHAFEHDRWRDAQLLAFGYRTLRITWRRLRDEPEAVVALLRALLAQG